MFKTLTSRVFPVVFAAVVGISCAPQNNPSGEMDGGLVDSGGDAGVDSAGELPAFDFHVLTFNASRFFDTVCDSGACDDDDFERQLSQAEFDFKADQMAEAIAEIGPDAVLLQELENTTCLDALASRLPDYQVAEFGEIGGPATLDVAVLAKDVEHLETRKHRERTELLLDDGRTRRFAREFLEVHVERDGRRIALFDAHFKSKSNDDPKWRLAEARGAREIVLETAEEFPDALVVFGGDLNDTPGSEPLDALLDGGEISRVTDDIAPDDAWTFRYFDDRIAIDHLLIADNGGGRYVDDSAEVIRDASGTFATSDHAAVAARFDVFLE